MNNPKNLIGKATIKEFEKFIEAEKKLRCYFCNNPLINGTDSKTKKKSKYIWVCDCDKFRKAGIRMMRG